MFPQEHLSCKTVSQGEEIEHWPPFQNSQRTALGIQLHIGDQSETKFTFRQGCHGTGKTGNLDVHYYRQEKHRKCAKNNKNMFLHREFTSNRGGGGNFEVLKIKGSTRIVVQYSYNLLALKQILSWGNNPIMEWEFLQQALLYLVLWLRVYTGSSISLYGHW